MMCEGSMDIDNINALIAFNESQKNEIAKMVNHLEKNGLDYHQIIKMIEKRDSDRQNMIDIYAKFDALNIEDCFLMASIVKTRKSYISLQERQCEEDALLNLDCVYWVKLLEKTNVREYMDYTAYEDMLTKFKTRDKDNHIIFSANNVFNFIDALLMNRHTMYATKIKGIIDNLSGSYKTNQGNSLSAVFILNSPSYSNAIGWEKLQMIDDLRDAVNQMFNLPKNEEKLNAFIYGYNVGEWYDLDSGLLRIKRYGNGNVHLHLSDLVYDKIVDVYSHLAIKILDVDYSKTKRKTFKFVGNLG